jgi:lipoprotein NlpD
MNKAFSAPRLAMLCGFLAAFAGALSGCASKSHAPVVERGAPPVKAPAATPQAAKAGEFYTVKKGDTLYSIALEHGVSYRDLAAWNNIENPALIRIGQPLRVAPPDGAAIVKPIDAPASVEVRALTSSAARNSDTHKREPKGGKQPYSEQAVAAAQKPDESRPPVVAGADPKPVAQAGVHGDELEWLWPSAGKIMAGFVEGGSKGVDIGGKIGEPVLASAAGKVIYAGSGIRGYGNLVIVQHAGSMSSVYAHNSKLLAREGLQVTKGQKIAELGNTDTDQAKLHFEIRHQGKPVDPLKYLPLR